MKFGHQPRPAPGRAAAVSPYPERDGRSGSGSGSDDREALPLGREGEPPVQRFRIMDDGEIRRMPDREI